MDFCSAVDNEAVKQLNREELWGHKISVKYRNVILDDPLETIPPNGPEDVPVLTHADTYGTFARNESPNTLPDPPSREAAQHVSLTFQDTASSTSQSVSGKPAPKLTPTSRWLPLPSQNLDLNEPWVLETYIRILLFKSDTEGPESLDFPKDLTARQRQIVHLLAQKMGLEGKSLGKDSQRYIQVKRK